MSDIYKSSKDYESLNLSNISDLDPDEIERLVREHSSKPNQKDPADFQPSVRTTPGLEISASSSVRSRKAVELEGGGSLPEMDGELGQSKQKSSDTQDWLGLKEKNKGRLLEELFPSPKTDEGDKGSYLPSSATSRRPASARSRGESGKRSERGLIEPSFSSSSIVPGASEEKNPGGGGDGLPDWLKTSETVDRPASKSALPAWLTTETNLPSRSLEKPKEQAAAAAVGLPADWLPTGTDTVAASGPSKVGPQEAPLPPSQPTTEKEGGSKELVSLLTRLQKELGSAMAKRHENLQNSLKALMSEAERVLSFPQFGMTASGDHLVVGKSAEEGRDASEAPPTTTQESKTLDQLKLSELELQNSRLLLEIKSLESTHEMEIETIKKNHSFELSALEERIERMKRSFDEIEEDYLGKIKKLKENEAALISEYKGKLEKAEEERLGQIEKLTELHQATLRQAVSLGLPAPQLLQTGVGGGLKVPWWTDWSQPKDEAELSAREAELFKKEEQLKVEKSGLDREKDELEGLRREVEARDRELTRKEREDRGREEARAAELDRKEELLVSLQLQIKEMQEKAVTEQGELAKEKLELARDRARLEAVFSIHGRSDASLAPLDIFQARVEVEGAVEGAREAAEAAERERRKHAELRQTLERITWEQKEAELRLENRERHLVTIMESAEKIRAEGLAALEEANRLKAQVETKEKEIEERIKRIESQEKILSKERMDIAKEKLDIEMKRSHLDVFLSDHSLQEELTLNVPRVYVDPKAVILRLKAEKEFESHTAFQKV